MRPILIILLLFAAVGCLQPTFAQFPQILWEREGAGPHSAYGHAIMPLGDQNDDGFADWAVLGIGDWPPDPPNHAVLEFFHGGNPPDPNPYKTWLLDPERMIAPFYGAPCGDLNGDGFMDWFLAYRPHGGVPESRAYEVYFGGPLGDDELDFIFTVNVSHWILPTSDNDGDRIDFNRDGFDDLIIYFQIPLDYTAILFGGEILDDTPDWIVHSNPAGSQSTVPITTGDFSGNGAADIVCSDLYNPHTTYIYCGGSDPDTLLDYTWPSFDAWPSSGEVDLNNDGFADLVRAQGGVLDVDQGPLGEIPETDAQFDFPGCSGIATTLTSARDFNSDGFDDFVAVSPGCSWWGKLSLYLGGRWLGQNSAFDLYGRTTPLNIFALSEAEGVGDINGDGIDDLAIGGYDSSTEGERGKAVIISGDTSFIAPVNNGSILHPSSFILHPCFPNPFNSLTTITLSLPFTQQLDLSLFDITGRSVKNIAHSRFAAGNHAIQINAAGLPSGIYFVCAQSHLQSATEKIVLLR